MALARWPLINIDKRTVITVSFNWSPSAAHQNDEVLLEIDSPLLAAHFTREMDRLWKGGVLGSRSGSPQSCSRQAELCQWDRERVS
jgi:phosphatidylserine/phosphatidylglycerophosphate/cardiolipin synthase-like enzyme